jgi:hypothetical protein
MSISSSVDRIDLRPGEYVLEDLNIAPRPTHRIDRRLSAFVRERDGFTCQTCGAGAGDPDDVTGRPVRLHVDHIDPDGPTEEMNLRTLCSACNEGRSNLRLPKSSINVLATVRRSTRADQLAAYEWLKRKFRDS